MKFTSLFFTNMLPMALILILSLGTHYSSAAALPDSESASKDIIARSPLAAPNPEQMIDLPTRTPSDAPALANRAVTSWASASTEGVFGECWWDWTGLTSIKKAHCAVKDTKGNSNSVFVRINVKGYFGGLSLGTVAYFENEKGHNAPEQYDLTFHSFGNGNHIRAAEVEACNDGGWQNTCKKSREIPNPYA
ncbi:hypothetical protein FRC03_004631 [Tulasnella sp. 419]|nr:hypothetical protein FRC03_004631 [Tulasnella sp. 419]